MHATIVGGGSEESAEFGVSPAHTPNCAFVAAKGFGEVVFVTIDFEDLDCFIAGAGCKAAAIVVQDCIVLEGDG